MTAASPRALPVMEDLPPDLIRLSQLFIVTAAVVCGGFTHRSVSFCRNRIKRRPAEQQETVS
jgi:hypothetical protein